MMGAPAFFKLLPLLAAERTVYAVDIIGMGGSDRPPFNARSMSAEQAEDLLVEPFERWAKAMQLPAFVLVGHSFGGFVAGCWATRNVMPTVRGRGAAHDGVRRSFHGHAVFDRACCN